MGNMTVWPVDTGGISPATSSLVTTINSGFWPKVNATFPFTNVATDSSSHPRGWFTTHPGSSPSYVPYMRLDQVTNSAYQWRNADTRQDSWSGSFTLPSAGYNSFSLCGILLDAPGDPYDDYYIAWPVIRALSGYWWLFNAA